jgi:two-component system, NtrC family, nitrogen regulation sensor histidine kinase NtrY
VSEPTPEIATGAAPPRDDEARAGEEGPSDEPGPSSRGALRRSDLSSPRRFSIAGKVTGSVTAILATMAAVAVGGIRFEQPLWAIFTLMVGVGLLLTAWVVARLLAPLDRVVRGVADGIRSFRDHDFSVRLAYRRDDELGDLVRLYNDVGQLLQEERHLLRQRELLLQTALDRSPAAIMLVGPTGRIVYGNREARHLLLGGGVLEGRSFADLREGCPPEMQEVLASDSDGLFTVRVAVGEVEERTETYHLARRRFLLNYRQHDLVLLRRLTGELGRREAETWKKVLRVVSHELNNSLAPISSLVHSARIVASDPRHAHRVDEVFDTLRERLDHLQRFLDGYARFARLPRPRKEAVDWPRFLELLREFPQVRLQGAAPATPGCFDPSQLRQVLVNLFKNAAEASAGTPQEGSEIALRVEAAREGGSWIQVSDHGRGMDEETMRQALLPFYSTKPGGSGLGLALCREILEAHGGKLSLQSRPGGGAVVTCWLPPR